MERGKAITAEAERRKTRRERWTELNRNLLAANKDCALADQYDSLLEDKDNLEKKQQDFAAEAERMKKQVEETHEQVQAHESEFQECARDVARGVLGGQADATIKFQDRAVAVNVTYSGARHSTAFDSFDAWLFDVAALLMAIEGRANLPAFWLHDSPREGDLGYSIYEQYFRYMLDLEERSRSQPGSEPFQYIITTTTEPPQAARIKPWLVLKLDGVNAGERLLRRTV
jgi:hypothetical protein